jgi:hypothetical protein
MNFGERGGTLVCIPAKKVVESKIGTIYHERARRDRFTTFLILRDSGGGGRSGGRGGV